MARLRSASAYRILKKPYTRKSKFRKKGYVKGIPGSKIVKFDIGNLKKAFPVSLTLLAGKNINLRHNAIEAARIAATKYLESKLGRENFHLKIRAVPHHIMRENPLATGAGADRFQEGMTRAFGKPIGVSARMFKDKPILQVFVEEHGIADAKEALRKASSKFPISCYVKEN